MKGSVMLAKLLSRRPHALLGSFSSSQPTANMLWGGRHAAVRPAAASGTGLGHVGTATPHRSPHPGHGRAVGGRHSLVNLQVSSANARAHGEGDRVPQEHNVRLLHLLSWGTDAADGGRGVQGWHKVLTEARRGLGGVPGPLTRLVPVKLGVEVVLRVEGHLDLLGHLQPAAGDRLAQVPGQGSSEAQAGGRVESGGLQPRQCRLAPRVLGLGRALGADLFWSRTLVYTELLTPEWYSSGGMTPGHTRARGCLLPSSWLTLGDRNHTRC